MSNSRWWKHTWVLPIDCVVGVGAYGEQHSHSHTVCTMRGLGTMPFASATLSTLFLGGEMILNYDFSFLTSIPDRWQSAEHNEIEIYILRKHNRWFRLCACISALCVQPTHRDEKIKITPQIKQTNIILYRKTTYSMWNVNNWIRLHAHY